MITISITDISIRCMVLTSEAPSASCPQAWLKNQSANNSNKQEGRERRHSQGVNNTGGSHGRAGSRREPPCGNRLALTWVSSVTWAGQVQGSGSC